MTIPKIFQAAATSIMLVTTAAPSLAQQRESNITSPESLNAIAEMETLIRTFYSGDVGFTIRQQIRAKAKSDGQKLIEGGNTLSDNDTVVILDNIFFDRMLNAYIVPSNPNKLMAGERLVLGLCILDATAVKLDNLEKYLARTRDYETANIISEIGNQFREYRQSLHATYGRPDGKMCRAAYRYKM